MGKSNIPPALQACPSLPPCLLQAYCATSMLLPFDNTPHSLDCHHCGVLLAVIGVTLGPKGVHHMRHTRLIWCCDGVVVVLVVALLLLVSLAMDRGGGAQTRKDKQATSQHSTQTHPPATPPRPPKHTHTNPHPLLGVPLPGDSASCPCSLLTYSLRRWTSVPHASLMWTCGTRSRFWRSSSRRSTSSTSIHCVVGGDRWVCVCVLWVCGEWMGRNWC